MGTHAQPLYHALSAAKLVHIPIFCYGMLALLPPHLALDLAHLIFLFADMKPTSTPPHLALDLAHLMFVCADMKPTSTPPSPRSRLGSFDVYFGFLDSHATTQPHPHNNNTATPTT